ncbi:MAG: thiolase family protein [Chloroflexi bacterium]|nr:thiolase family protein [Chloroflexota bacterium]
MDFLQDVVVLGMGRTPRGKFGGTLRDVDVIDVGASIVPAVLKRAGVRPEQVDMVTWGHTRPTGYEGNTGRLVALQAGIPIDVPAFTINMACISAMQAVISGIQEIVTGNASIVLAGGMESMSTGNYLLKGARWGFKSGPQTLVDELYVPPRSSRFGMGETAENVAEKYGIKREEQDSFSFQSHQKAARAQDNGYFEDEIVPMEIPQPKGPPIVFSRDECIRRDTSIEKLATLVPIFRKGGTITAGNSCPLTDGSNAIVIASRNKAQELGLKPLASFLSYATAAVDPAYMGIGPVVSVPKALDRAGLRLDDVDLVEQNEAFASIVLASAKELNYDYGKLNVHGGAISLGHPTGSSGSRLLITLYHALKRRGKHIGLATLCGGTGVTGAIIMRRES